MRARKLVWIGLLAAGVLGTGSAYAVSDGNYNDKKQGCSDDAFNSDPGTTAEKGCYALVYRIMDGSGHSYVTVGIPETPEHQRQNTVVACYDFGTGTEQCVQFQKGHTGKQFPHKGTPAKPQSGISVYFGANDNLDGGEHDSSSQVNNGPSDGGGIQANLTGKSAVDWAKALAGLDTSYLLTHPLPAADFGTGFCADGLCISINSQRHVAYQGGGTGERDVADYGGHQWDPESCSGPSDQPEDCGGHDIAYWNDQNGTTYVEPGVQVYEDPDPQGSPIIQYPIPAVYAGTCGLVIGGGGINAPASPFTNDAGQLVVKTGC